MDRRRSINLVAAIAAITVFGFALGLMFPLLSLIMEKTGISPEIIGYNTAMQPLGIVLAGLIVPRLTRRWGTKPVAIAAAGATAIIVVAYPFLPIFWAWFALRLIHGFAVSILFAVSESWVVQSAEGAARSRFMAVYSGVLALGFGSGPTVIALTGIETILPFIIGAAVIAAAMIPMFLYREVRPPETDGESVALSTISFAPKAPTLLVAVCMFGIMDAAYLGFLPVYGVKKGLSQDVASLMLTAFIVGNVVLQFPIGWLADHVNKRAVMAGCVIAVALGSALVPISFASWIVWPLLLVTGAASAGIYTVALADLGDRFTGHELVSGTASFSTMWGGGALIGALVAGWAFETFGPDGLPYTLAAIFAAFVVLIFARWAFTSQSLRRA